MVNPMQAFMGVASQYGSLSVKELSDGLRKTSHTLSKAPITDIDKFLDLLNKRNGIAACFLLDHKTKRGEEAIYDIPLINRQARQLVETLPDNELEYIADKFIQTFSNLATLLVEAKCPLHGLRTLQLAIDKLTKGVKGTVTGLHAALFALCLRAKRFDVAVPYLNVDAEVVFMNAIQSGNIDSQSALLFFYYGGLVLLALEDLAAASNFFHMCACLPAVSASAIMLEALKKCVLVNILLDKNVNLPSYRSAAIQRASQVKCRTYFSLATLIQDVYKRDKKGTRANRSFESWFAKNKDEIIQDNNVGLIEKVKDYGFILKARRLPQLFTRLKIADAPAHFDLNDSSVDSLILLKNIIEKGKIPGKIDVRSNSIDFDVNTDSECSHQALEDAMNKAVELATVLQKCHHEVNLHPVYLQRSGKKGSVGPPFAAGFTVDDEGFVAQGTSS